MIRDDNGIIITTMKACGRVDEDDVKELNKVTWEIAGGQPALKLLLAGGGWDMTRKATEIAESEDSGSRTRARAIVVSNPLKASLFNFLKSLSEKDYPQQFFDKRDHAYQWLMAFKTDGLQIPMF